MSLTAELCAYAHDLGLDWVGVTSPFPVPGLAFYTAWIAQGYHGEMAYLARPDRLERRADPAKILPGVRSFISVGVNYYSGRLPVALADDPARGRISTYAWGNDYHAWLLPRLEALAAFVEQTAGHAVAWRAYVDTGPILERAYAAQAGLGFIGKNTCLIQPRAGSWLFLGELLTDLVLDPTPAEVSGGCGSCTRCLAACPTGALSAPYMLDARRCISYLTIELKGPIPLDLRPLLGNHIYGCDRCQEVCPWQRFAVPTAEPAFRSAEAAHTAPLLLDLLRLDADAFDAQYRGSALHRIGRRRLLRNVVVALGNWGASEALPGLIAALRDAEPLVRGHAAWAVGRIGGAGAHRALQVALSSEPDPYVQQELRAALVMI